MVFGLLSGLLSILSSALVYLAGAIIFSNKKEVLVAYVAALIVITVVLFLVRLLFFKGEGRMRFAMRSMRPRGLARWSMVRKYKHIHERKVISGGVARILAFGLIFYLSSGTLIVVYGAVAFAILSGIVFLMSFRHKFIDLITGAVLGIVAGYFSLQFAPLIMRILGF